MVTIDIWVADETKEVILDSYQTLGWGLLHDFYRNSHCYGLRLIWPHEGDPKYPDVSDAGGPRPVHIQ